MRKRILIFWSIFLAAAIFRLWQSFDFKAPEPGYCLNQSVKGFGLIQEEPERKETGQVMVVLVEEMSLINRDWPCPVAFRIRLKTKLYPRFDYGQTVVFTGKLLAPSNFESDNGRSFDYIGYLAKDNVYFEMKSAVVGLAEAKSNNQAENKLSRGIEKSIPTALFRLKRSFVANLEKVLGEPHAALAAGLVVGEKAALGKELLESFRIVGLIHIVVLSGFNITIVGEAIRRLLSFLPRVWGIILGGLGIILFGILVGGGATVIRSCFMAGIALSADLIRRDYSVIRALIFAGLVMVIQNPLILLHDPSFQLSFLATLGLIILSGPFEKRLNFITDKIGIRGIVAATLATQIFVLPFILYMMGQLSLIGTLVNVIVLPFIPLTMFLVFLTGLTGFIWFPLSQAFGWLTHLLLSHELFIVEKFASLPLASVNVSVFSGWWVVGFYGILFVVLLIYYNRQRV